MVTHRFNLTALSVVTLLVLTGCSSGGLGNTLGGLFGGEKETTYATIDDATIEAATATAASPPPPARVVGEYEAPKGAFGSKKVDPNVTVQVNKYIWSAALDVLNFLPVQNADPFTGIITTDYGTPPGGGRSYRATIFVQDPALDARSLRVSLHTRGGTASAKTVEAVEDAILTRARQLRVADKNL